VNLEKKVDASSIVLTGILSIDLPKAAASRARKVEVKAA